MSKLPLYQCHKMVRAARIVGIEPCDTELNTVLNLSEQFPDGVARAVKVDTAWKTRNPKTAIGGYFVVYEDENGEFTNKSYTAYSPAAPFEAGYTLAGSDPAVRIIFGTESASPDLTFVEIENREGKAVSVGTWSEDPAGYKVLTITAAGVHSA